MEPLHRNARRVQAALHEAGSTAQVVQLDTGARTSAQAAESLGVDLAQIAKSMVFLADGEPVVVVASGADRIDIAALAAHLGGARITRADADAVRAATGYPIGGVSPAGLPAGTTVLVEEALSAFDVVWAAGGTPHTVFATTYEELLRLTGGAPSNVREH